MRQGVYNELRSVDRLLRQRSSISARIPTPIARLLADTPERQAVACCEMNERVLAAYQAHRARANRRL